jgi:hypothetical protein
MRDEYNDTLIRARKTAEKPPRIDGLTILYLLIGVIILAAIVVYIF